MNNIEAAVRDVTTFQSSNTSKLWGFQATIT